MPWQSKAWVTTMVIKHLEMQPQRQGRYRSIPLILVKFSDLQTIKALRFLKQMDNSTKLTVLQVGLLILTIQIHYRRWAAPVQAQVAKALVTKALVPKAQSTKALATKALVPKALALKALVPKALALKALALKVLAPKALSPNPLLSPHKIRVKHQVSTVAVTIVFNLGTT
jgi:hypothetical protein